MGDPATPDLTAYRVDLRPRRRPGYTATVQLCTWDLVVLRVHGPAGEGPVFVARPGTEVGALLADLDAGRHDADLRSALVRPPRRRLTRPVRTTPLLRVGVEHEYRVLGPEGPVDFRGLVDGLDLGVRADPTDPRAQRAPWGGVVTADSAEAEVATPPVAVRPGAVADVVGLAALGRGELASALGRGFDLEGYSTHLNVSAPQRGDTRRATVFAKVFASSLMLLLDRPTSPGLLVRPRPGRLELGGEFAQGAGLAVALTFATGAVLACSAMGRRTARALAVDVDLERARERFGWYVDRRAFGVDLYAVGRSAPLSRRATGAMVSAGRQLEETWLVARDALEGRLGEDDLAAVDRVIGGSGPLPRPQEGVAS